MLFINLKSSQVLVIYIGMRKWDVNAPCTGYWCAATQVTPWPYTVLFSSLNVHFDVLQYIFWKNIWQETASLTIESFCSTVHGILMQKLFVYIHKYLYLLFCNLLYKNFLNKCPAYIKKIYKSIFDTFNFFIQYCKQPMGQKFQKYVSM